MRASISKIVGDGRGGERQEDRSTKTAARINRKNKGESRENHTTEFFSHTSWTGEAESSAHIGGIF